MRRLLQRLDAYDKAHPVWMHDDIRAHSRGRKGVIVAALVCVLAMMAGCSGVTQALDTPADGFDRIVSANGNGYDGDDMNTADDSVGDAMVAPAVDVSNDDDVVVRSVVDDSSDERVAPQAEGDGLSWPEGGLTGETTVTYDANGKGSFADGATTNAVTTKYKGYKKVTKYAHTDNVDDAGVQNGGYGDNQSYSRVVTIPGAPSLTVDLTYQTESKGYDWVCAYAGVNAGDVNCSASLTGKLGGRGRTTKTFAVDGDSVTFWFKSDGSSSNYYGYYAVVKGFVGSKKHASGTYAVPVDSSDEYKFVGWNTKANGSGENLGDGEVYLSSNQTVYAQWKSNYTKWNTISWRITDDGILKIRPWEGDTGTTGSVTDYPYAPWSPQSSKIKKVESTGNIVLNAKSNYLFYNCSNLTDLTGLSSWDASNVTSMRDMFLICSNLTDLTPLASWNVSKVTDMYSMFDGCSKLTDLTGLASWNVSRVTNMREMFSYCSNLIDISALVNWNVSKVTSMSDMFRSCSGLTDLSPLANWNVSKVTDMGAMFLDCSNLTDLTDLAGWNVSNVTGMSSMFYQCSNLTDISALANWNVSNVTNMRNVFQSCSNLTDLTGLAGWDVSKVTDMSIMFAGCSKLTDLTALAGWNVSNVTGMSSMFDGCSSLTDLTPLVSWNVSDVTNMNYMFHNCSNLTDLNGLAGWNVSEVTDMRGMFSNCSGLTDLSPLANWDVSNVTYISYMFQNCFKLTDLTGLAGWNVFEVTDMIGMFYGCSKLQKIGIPSIANGGQNLVNNASALYLDGYMPTIISEDLTMGPYSWSNLKSEMQTDPDAFQEGTIWVKYIPSWFVFYNANGGLGSQEYTKVPVSQSSIVLPQSSFVRFGYRFAGWTTQPGAVSDTNPLMQPGDMYAPPSVNENDRFTLYAQWESIGNIGDLPTSSQSGLLPGWVQIGQSNTQSIIPAMDTITASFTNKYDPNATSLELQFTKMMDGRIPDKSFDFELMDDAGKVLQTVKSVGSTVSFAPLSFNEVGEHIYYAHETNTTDSTIDYDTDLIQIKVSITADPDDATKLKATAQITGDTTFNNTSKPASLTISKKVEGADDQSRSFTFDVMLTDRDNKPVNGSFVIDVSNGAQSSVTFVDGKAQVTIPANARLTIHGIDAYTSYQVSEPADTMPGGYTLDAITGDVGVLAPAGSSTVTATNTYAAQPVYVTLHATKRLLDKVGDESIMDVGQFSFSLCRVESDDPASPCVGVSDASNDGAGNIAFEQLVFDAPGTYTYRIKEVNSGDAWTQYDKSIIEAIITVSDNAEGKLVADVAYRHADGTPMSDDATMPVFTNVALDRGGFAVTGSGPWMIAGIVAIIMMALALVVALIRRIATV